MTFIKTKTGLTIIALIVVFAFLYLFTGVFGETRINLTLLTNPNLANGLVAHYTFDTAAEAGTYEFGTGGSITPDPDNGNDAIRSIEIDDGFMYLGGDEATNATDCLSGGACWRGA